MQKGCIRHKALKNLAGEKLDLVKVKYSIKNSKDKLKRIFHIENIKYICNPWLLSNQIYKLVEKILIFHFFMICLL